MTAAIMSARPTHVQSCGGECRMLNGEKTDANSAPCSGSRVGLNNLTAISIQVAGSEPHEHAHSQTGAHIEVKAAKWFRLTNGPNACPPNGKCP